MTKGEFDAVNAESTDYLMGKRETSRKRLRQREGDTVGRKEIDHCDKDV